MAMAANVTPGILGFAVIAALGFVLYLLLKNMNQRISRLRFEEREQAERSEASDKADTGPERG
ncbi:hypothetical protein [Allonocardiopsis opalescens]|uniref:Uncharacterized protein n=1 Tax=Allonocardiopsis opalescens TaxID=1144618 RepID=A0A2T0QD57_9ACTN|nr:hypothetical protein [Allonocardiopsis opalescens]PRY01886.1 hypothetical protein CLV72_101484 [Allonocardiopsis opalescens]